MRRKKLFLVVVVSLLIAAPIVHADMVCEDGHTVEINGVTYCNPGAPYYSWQYCMRCYESITVCDCRPENPTP